MILVIPLGGEPRWLLHSKWKTVGFLKKKSVPHKRGLLMKIERSNPPKEVRLDWLQQSLQGADC